MDKMEEITLAGISVEKFEQMFGKVRPNVCKNLTQEFLNAYHRISYQGHGEQSLVIGFGLDWMERLLEYNESVEEYEICSVLHELIEKYK